MFNKISGSIKTTKFSYKLKKKGVLESPKLTPLQLLNCATELIFFSVFWCVELVQTNSLQIAIIGKYVPVVLRVSISFC